MGQWLDGWVHGSMGGPADSWVGRWVSGWMGGRVGQRIGWWVDGSRRMGGWGGGWVPGSLPLKQEHREKALLPHSSRSTFPWGLGNFTC